MTLRGVLYRLNRNKLTILGLLAAVLAGVEAGDSLVGVALAAVTLLQRQLVTPADEVLVSSHGLPNGTIVTVAPPEAQFPQVVDGPDEAPAVDDRSFI